MLKLLTLLFVIGCLAPIMWHTDLSEAQQIAKKKHRHILLNFSGSDWCKPCIRMRKDVFGNAAFVEMADSQLVMVNADFPRMKKNLLPADQQQRNNAMADKYNPQGKFPLTLLLTEDGAVVTAWDGYPDMSPETFSREVSAATETRYSGTAR